MTPHYRVQHLPSSEILCLMPQWRPMDQVCTMERHSCCALIMAAALTSSLHGIFCTLELLPSVKLLTSWLISYQAFFNNKFAFVLFN